MGDYKAHGQKMWKILTNTFFTSYPPFEINDCSGNIMYGGPGKTSKNEIQFSFQLPVHTRIKIALTYHYLDQWNGALGYVKYIKYDESIKAKKHEFLWIRKQDSKAVQSKSEGALSVCGKYPDAHFSQAVDVAFGHTETKLTLIIGSTLSNENPDLASYGVSNIQIYTL